MKSRESGPDPAGITLTKRGLLLGALAALLTFPWLSFVIWWQSWAAWLLPVVVYLALFWLLDRLTERRRLRDLERRLAALEEREIARGRVRHRRAVRGPEGREPSSRRTPGERSDD